MTKERVTFDSHGETLVGHLHLPDGPGPHPAVVVLGPETFVKEQAPTEYARRLAVDGVAALAFDPRYAGESSGEPRRWENPARKVEDVSAAVDFLASRDDIDGGKIGGVAVCQGNSEMLRAAADDDRIRAYCGVAGHYRDAEGDLEWMGSQEALDARRQRGEDAARRYRETGEAEYVPAVDPERDDVGMPGAFVWDWYRSWTDRGWDNRYAVMSDADVLGYESISAARRLTTPTLIVHGDNSFLPAAARRHFEAIPTSDKRLDWDGETAHFQYYDDPVVIDRTVGRFVGWLREHLGLEKPLSVRLMERGA
jgi:fermentation-respiration switch protein FrsA (DUF1100 family)